MRVIAGLYKGRRLKTVEGLQVRPTSDRLRETLFNILAPRLEGARFLDLCAGSGAVGIEALSRGAAEVTFVEASRRAAMVIGDNLHHCRIAAGARVVNRDALTALKYFAAHGLRFDLCYFDPPYDSEIYSPALWLIDRQGLATPGGVVVVEHRRGQGPGAGFDHLTAYRELAQGESGLTFFKFQI